MLEMTVPPPGPNEKRKANLIQVVPKCKLRLEVTYCASELLLKTVAKEDLGSKDANIHVWAHC